MSGVSSAEERSQVQSFLHSYLQRWRLDAYLHALGSRNFINGRTGTAVWNPCDLGNRIQYLRYNQIGRHSPRRWLGTSSWRRRRGYQIGLQTLKTVIKSHEGILPPTIMSDLIVATYPLQHITDLKSYIYQPAITKQDIASFARRA